MDEIPERCVIDKNMSVNKRHVFIRQMNLSASDYMPLFFTFYIVG